MPCIEAKATDQLNTDKFSSDKRAEKPGDLIALDILILTGGETFNGNTCALNVIDEHSGYVHSIPMQSKHASWRSEGGLCAIETVILDYKKNNHQPKVLRFDGEFDPKRNTYMKELLAKHNLSYQVTVPGESRQNGLIENTNRVLPEMATAMMRGAPVGPLGHQFAGVALEHAASVRNRLPRHGKLVTPYEASRG